MSVTSWLSGRSRRHRPRSRLASGLLGLALILQYALGAVIPAAALAGAAAVASVDAAPLATVQNGCGTYPLDVELLIDTSGSMGSNTSGSPAHSRLYYAQHAADQLIDDLQANGGLGGTNGLNQLGVSQFHGSSSNVSVVAQLGDHDSATALKTAVDGLSANDNTPLKTGMATAASDMTAGQRATFSGTSVTHVLILLSDGAPNPDQTSGGDPTNWGTWASTPNSSQRPSSSDGASYLASADMAFSIAIGVPNGEGVQSVDQGLMALLAKPSDATHAIKIDDADQLPGIFSSIFREIACKPTLTTQASPTTDLVAGQAATVGDTATMVGGSSPSGTITFKLYDNPNCDGTAVVSGSDTLSGGEASISKSWTPTTAGTYVWQAAYSGDDNNDPFTACGGDGETITVVAAAPNIGVVKTTSTPTVSAGDTVRYKLTVSAGGNAPSTHVTLTDNLPGGLDWAADDTDHCSIAGATLSCDFGTMQVNDTHAVNLSAATTKADCGVLHNAASVSADSDAKASDSTSGPIDVAINCGDISLAKTADAASVSAGDKIGYTITVSNSNQGFTAHDVTVLDNVPSAPGTSWSVDAAHTTGTWSLVAGQLVFGPRDLAPGASFHVHLVSGTTAATCGTISNSASAATSNDGSPSVGPVEIVVDCPALGLTKTADAGAVSAGSQIGFTITLSNAGKGIARGAHVTDDLPASAGTSWSIDAAGTTGTWALVGNSLTFGPQDLPASASVHVHLVSGTSAVTCGTVTNTASADLSNGLAPDPAAASVVVACPDLALVKSADASAVSAGESIGFTVTLSNVGQGSAANARVNDPLPGGPGISWSIDGSAPGWSISGSAPNQTLSYSANILKDGASTSVHVVSATDKSSCQAYDNSATASAANEPSTALDNNTAEASTSVQCGALLVTKTADAASVDAGDQIGFTITVQNTGAGSLNGVSISDALPTTAGLDWSVVSTSTGSASIASGLLTFDVGSLPAQASASVHLVSQTALNSCATITNQATASAANADDQPSNTASVVVNCPALHVVKSVDKAAARPGDVLHYTLDLTNDGRGEARDVSVSDDIADLLAHGAYNGDASYGGSLSATTLSWSDLAVPAGGELKLTFSVTLAGSGWPVGLTELPNTVVVTGPPNDCQAESNDPDCSTATTVTIPRIAIAKTLTSGASGGSGNGTPVAKKGDVLTYTLTFTVTNGPATDVTVTDSLPEGLEYVAGSATAGGQVSPDGRMLSWTFATLADGDSVSYQATVLDTAPGQVQPLVNTATVVALGTNCAEGSDDPDCVSSANVTVPVPLPSTPASPTPSPTPNKTLPPTDVSGPGGVGQGGAPILPLLLLGLAGLALGIRVLTPGPDRRRAEAGRRQAGRRR